MILEANLNDNIIYIGFVVNGTTGEITGGMLKFGSSGRNYLLWEAFLPLWRPY